jgi:hypothetical protein
VLRSYGGRKVVRANDDTCHDTYGVLGSFGGVPVFGRSWRIRYLVRGVPSGALPIAPIPLA